MDTPDITPNLNAIRDIIKKYKNASNLEKECNLLYDMYHPKIMFAKMKPNAIIPSKEPYNACYDIYACLDQNEIMFAPGEIKLVPTGIASVFDSKYYAKIHERGSSYKQRLTLKAGIIDSSYRGEWFVCLANYTDIPIEITNSIDDYEITEDFIRIPANKAIAQFSMEEVLDFRIEEISLSELANYPTERGDGKIGSSGK